MGAITNVLSKKWIHMTVLSAFVIVAMFLPPELFPVETTSTGRIVFALLPIIAWSLGRQYERAIILVSGVMDEDDLSRIEYDYGSMWRDPDAGTERE